MSDSAANQRLNGRAASLRRRRSRLGVRTRRRVRGGLKSGTLLELIEHIDAHDDLLAAFRRRLILIRRTCRLRDRSCVSRP